MRVQVTSHGILRTLERRPLPGLVLSPRVVEPAQPWRLEAETQAVLGWGRKRSGEAARRIAKARGLGAILAEDGFVRSVFREDAPLSLILDGPGVHYDPAEPSTIDRALDAQDPASAAAREARIRAVAAAMRAGGVSKYNNTRDPERLPPRPYVLVADQAKDDLSVHASGGTEADFRRMLDLAREENPGRLVVVRTHPDRAAGKAGGYFAAAGGAAPEAGILRDPGDRHISLLVDGADHVYVFSSQVGFEALLRGKPVTCFGSPFFAHRGLTRDFGPKPAYPRARAEIAALAHAALIDAPLYFHPETGAPAEIETVIEHVALYRRTIAADPERAVLHGFSRRKAAIARRFFPATAFVNDARVIAAEPTLPVIAWSKRYDDRAKEMRGALPERPSRIIRVEDGFTRSKGLGAAFAPPLSWTIDPVGIHYDHAAPSLIERTLLEHAYSESDRRRAASYRAKLLALGISKYNLHAGRAWRRPEAGHVVLVPGQVEDDMSIRFGSPRVRSNRALLAAVRARHPQAYILYRPHPDVAGGYRRGDPSADAKDLADEIGGDTDIDDVLRKVDAVEVMTSLAGMEALLRGVPVTCHGAPFYAGWGLTEDLVSIARRGRRLTLDELVFGALIACPRFIGPVCGAPITAEQAVDALAAARPEEPSRLMSLAARIVGRWRPRLRADDGTGQATAAARGTAG